MLNVYKYNNLIEITKQFTSERLCHLLAFYVC